jgi:tetratricopeptide (TPR) repeat protein
LLGNAALSVSDFNKGEQAYISALEYNKNSPLILNNLAYAKIELAKYSDAVIYANKALEILPGQPELIDTLAVALLRSGKVDEALRALSVTYEEKAGNVSDAFILTYLEALVKSGDVGNYDTVYETHIWKDLKKKREAEALTE